MTTNAQAAGKTGATDAQKGPQARYVPLGHDAADDTHVVWSSQADRAHIIKPDGTRGVVRVTGDELDAFLNHCADVADEWIQQYGRLSPVLEDGA